MLHALSPVQDSCVCIWAIFASLLHSGNNVDKLFDLIFLGSCHILSARIPIPWARAKTRPAENEAYLHVELQPRACCNPSHLPCVTGICVYIINIMQVGRNTKSLGHRNPQHQLPKLVWTEYLQTKQRVHGVN